MKDSVPIRNPFVVRLAHSLRLAAILAVLPWSVAPVAVAAAAAERPFPEANQRMTKDTNFWVFLCFGQSNMEGFPGVPASDKRGVDDRFKVQRPHPVMS